MNIECLKDKIGEEDANALLNIYNGLPRTLNELVGILTAAVIRQNDITSEQNELENEPTTFISSFAGAVPVGGNTTLTSIGAVPAEAKSVSITALESDIVFTFNGINPDYATSVGHVIPRDTTININSDNLGAIIFNPTSGTDAAVYVSYFTK